MIHNQQAIKVDIVSDVVCPWCAIGYHQLAKASKETGIVLDISWHPFELNPQMSDQGENLREHLAAKYGTTPEGSKAARVRFTEMGAALGFTFNYADDMRMWNTFRAHQLIDWADSLGKGHETKMALFAAYFGRRENISDLQVLADIATIIGMDRSQTLSILESGGRADIVRQKESFWTSRGIAGVPAMIFEEKHLVTGAQGERNYAQILRHFSTHFSKGSSR